MRRTGIWREHWGNADIPTEIKAAPGSKRYHSRNDTSTSETKIRIKRLGGWLRGQNTGEVQIPSTHMETGGAAQVAIQHRGGRDSPGKLAGWTSGIDELQVQQESLLSKLKKKQVRKTSGLYTCVHISTCTPHTHASTQTHTHTPVSE